MFAHEVESVFVDEHFRVFEPRFPGGFRYVLEEASAEGAFKGGLVESFRFLPQLHALHHFSHGEVP